MEGKNASPPFDNDDCSTLDGNEQTSFLNSHYEKEAKKKRNLLYLTFFNLFLFMLSALTLICAVFSQKSDSIHSTAKLMDQFGIFSPAMHVVEYHRTKLDLTNPRNSVYMGPSNDTDNAWKDIADLPDQMVREDDFSKLQKPTDSLKVSDPKTGETGYRAGLEVFHQLRCLNMLRMATYPNYSSNANGTPDKARAQLDECVEVLRLNLMCMADVNVFTYRTGGSPDYESHHVCRNFDEIKRWALENAMPSQGM